MHHFPPYSRAGEQINEKSMIFEPPAPARPRGAPSRTHTFQWFLRAPARPRAPPRRKKGHPPGRTRAYAFWSMSDHANPSYLPAACTSRTPINPPIIASGPESGLEPLQDHRTCRPRAGPSARTEGERRRPRQRPPAPGPPIFAIPLERGGPGGRGLCTCAPPAPCPSCLVDDAALDPISTHKLTTPAHGGGGLPLPAAAAAAP